MVMNRGIIVYSFAVSLLLPSLSNSQIPNASFENWRSTGWLDSNNDTICNPIGWNAINPLPYTSTFNRTTTSHSGTYALWGSVQWGRTFLFSPDLNTGFPLNYRPASFVGYFQFSPLGGDTLFVNIDIYSHNVPIAIAALTISSAISSYTQFQIPLSYLTSDTPDSCYIDFHIHNAKSFPNGTGTGGTYYLLDDLAFSGISEVLRDGKNEPMSFRLQQNYPNPFNPTTTIAFSVPTTEFVSIRIYDLLGRDVATLVDKQLIQGDYSVQWNAQVTSGIYFCRMRAGAFDYSKKLILLK